MCLPDLVLVVIGVARHIPPIATTFHSQMATRALLRIARPHTLTRSYVTVARTPASTLIKNQKVGTVPATGNPDVIKTPPNSSLEVETNGNVNGKENGNENGNGNGLSTEGQQGTDWSKSYNGLSTQAFSKDIVDILMAPVDPLDVEMKPGTFV